MLLCAQLLFSSYIHLFALSFQLKKKKKSETKNDCCETVLFFRKYLRGVLSSFVSTAIVSTPAFAGASPYSMGGASQGTPTPMMSPAPPGGPQDMAGYGMGINGSDYGSQPYNDGSMGYDPMHQVN